MTTRPFIVVVLLIAAISLSALPDTHAKSKKSRTILSTVDIDEEYEILGLVSYRSSQLSPEKMHTELRKQAEKLGADYVVGIRYYNNAGYLYATGTAVRLVKE